MENDFKEWINSEDYTRKNNSGLDRADYLIEKVKRVFAKETHKVIRKMYVEKLKQRCFSTLNQWDLKDLELNIDMYVLFYAAGEGWKNSFYEAPLP